MAWPASADAVIATANTQTTNIDTFISDVLAGAETTLVKSINAYPATYIDDPEWVDPLDGSTAPQIIDTYNISVSFASRGEFSAAAAEKMQEVAAALGLGA